jgi:hypothetical protein
MSASPLAAKQTAQLAPTFPAPTTVTLLFIFASFKRHRRHLHGVGGGCGELTSFQIDCTFNLRRKS